MPPGKPSEHGMVITARLVYEYRSAADLSLCKVCEKVRQEARFSRARPAIRRGIKEGMAMGLEERSTATRRMTGRRSSLVRYGSMSVPSRGSRAVFSRVQDQSVQGDEIKTENEVEEGQT